MGNFDRGGRGGRDRNRSNNSFRGDRRPQMHSAICDECGKKCEVPFKPTGDKPIYCSDCFQKREGGRRDGGSRDSRPRFNDRSRQGGENYKSQFEQINSKLDKLIKILSSDVSSEIKEEEPKKVKKAPKKEVDTVSLNKSVKKVTKKKAPAKKKSAKKQTKTKKTTKK